MGSDLGGSVGVYRILVTVRCHCILISISDNVVVRPLGDKPQELELRTFVGQIANFEHNLRVFSILLPSFSKNALASLLSLGLLISTLAKNQFAASQAALIAGFLPAFELSGFIFEIDSMPAPIRLLASVLPPRYFVSSMQTIFLAGDVPSVLVPNALVLVAMAAVLFVALVRATPVRLE